MIRLPLTQGYVAVIDTKDQRLARHRWHAVVRKVTVYAGRMVMRDGKRHLLLLHRAILAVTDPSIPVDHRDRNGLNNRRRNLRISTPAKNARNTVSREGATSRHLGVSWDQSRGKWRAEIRTDAGKLFLGRFSTERAAATARKAAERRHWT